MGVSELIKRLKVHLKPRPEPPMPEPPMPTWEDIDPEGEAAREELLRAVEEDTRQQHEALTEALRSPN